MKNCFVHFAAMAVLLSCSLGRAAGNGDTGSANDLPALVMTGHDSAKAIYSDKCANGANIDDENREKFINNMLQDSQSQISKLKAQLLEEIVRSGETPRGEGFGLTPWISSFHERMGCGQSLNSYSAIAVTITGGNMNYRSSRFLITIDDDDTSGERVLKVRSIQPLQVREDD